MMFFCFTLISKGDFLLLFPNKIIDGIGKVYLLAGFLSRWKGVP